MHWPSFWMGAAFATTTITILVAFAPLVAWRIYVTAVRASLWKPPARRKSVRDTGNSRVETV